MSGVVGEMRKRAGKREDLIAIHQPVLLMELAQGAVCFHLGNDGVDKGEQIVLTFAHQHTNSASFSLSIVFYMISFTRKPRLVGSSIT